MLDPNGNRTRFTGIATQTDYAYDPLDQLTSETRPAATTSWTYDKVGKRLTETQGGTTMSYTYDAANRLTAAGGKTYARDGSGNQTTETSGGTSTTFNWDALNQLISLFGGTTASYTYNGDGLRVRSVVGGTTTNFAWDLGQETPQLLSDGNDHIWGPSGLVAAVASGGACVTYAFTDGLGNVQATKTSTMQATTRQYDAFGKPLPAPPDHCAPLRIGFAGEQRDNETGLTYLRARYMDPDTGRFLSRDPWSGTRAHPASQHAYTYALNNPLKYTDPSGMRPTVSYIGYLLATLGDQQFPLPFFYNDCIDDIGKKFREAATFLRDGLKD